MDKDTIARPASLQINKVVHHFQRDRLQDARSFYESQGAKLGRANSKGWSPVYGDICPSHRSKSGRSFSVNVIHGGWKCFGCGATGDVVKFVMLRDGLNFKEASQQLGAWDDAVQPTPQPPTILVNHLTFAFDIDGAHHRISVEDEPRNYPDMIRRFYREASDRLIELRRGDAERYTGEEENCWAQMVCAVDEWRANL